NGKHAAEIFADAMKWLWQDWPKPVTAGSTSNAMLHSLLIPGEDWQLVSEGYKFTEGPIANTRGEVFFNDIPASKTFKIGLDGKVSEFIADSKKANGLVFGPDGRLFAVASGTDQILAYDAQQKVTVVAEGFNGNDIVARQDGGLYVTNPDGKANTSSKLWFIAKNGEKKVVDTGLKFANGLALSPDQSLLMVAESRTHWIWSYQEQPDGELKFKQRYGWLHVPDNADDSGADGVRVDREGRLFVATRLGIQILDQAGRVNAIIPTPNGRIANLCFGGEKFDTLFATCGDKVFKRKLNTRGVNAFEPPFKPAAPRM
ncbi:MAG: SMP-30/gluconolactonase/LRE family protein, partial [Kiritimatiellaeota bacterium]|nr:SMP-30/gluconolactonase/LRE family protein [Kiritimatiellota bacterium]